MSLDAGAEEKHHADHHPNAITRHCTEDSLEGSEADLFKHVDFSKPSLYDGV